MTPRDLSPASHRVPRELLERYATNVPRYTSYPTAPSWRDTPSQAELEALLRRPSPRPLSLYVHLPFCRKLCFYCGCNMMVTRNQALVERYLRALETEIERVAALGRSEQPVTQIHWGGGTPTYLDCDQLTRVYRALAKHFPIRDGAEISIEVHPPVTTELQLQTLRDLGFNRVSMGVQDFDPRVQKAVNRPQPFEQTRDLILACRRMGYLSVNVDLMYGLPHQTVKSFGATLDRLEELRPDRLALFGYAHVPSLKPHQKLLSAQGLPVPSERLDIFESAVERLLNMGYRYIGLDHFALEDDELAVAQGEGLLQRNFMGYTTCAETDLLAFGASSISDLEGVYLQNAREVPNYLERVESGLLPVTRGTRLTDDDVLRREVIHRLFCRLELDKDELAVRHGVDVDTYFADELHRLAPLEADGLISRERDRLRVTPRGQVLLRNIAAVFDAHLRRPAEPRPMSQAV
jgi:oxygen-independent coproporphyrinogen-3 oxidase